jgi:excisionase family DNA binding protein
MQEAKQTELIDYGEAARRLGIKVATLYALVSKRRIPHVRLGRRFVRFDVRDLAAWVDAQRVSPDGQKSTLAPYSDL